MLPPQYEESVEGLFDFCKAQFKFGYRMSIGSEGEKGARKSSEDSFGRLTKSWSLDSSKTSTAMRC